MSLLDAFRRGRGNQTGDARIVVGLGNPGAEYDNTPHNIGFAVLDELKRRNGVSFRRGPQSGMETAVLAGKSKIVLMRPLTYMNRSGQPVSSVMNWFSANPGDLLIVCDDVNLPLGQLRLRQRGGAGGQKGLASIIQHLGTQEVARLRIGVGGGRPGADVADHVLSRFRGDRLKRAREMTCNAADAVECWLDEGIAAAMNRHNQNNSEE